MKVPTYHRTKELKPILPFGPKAYWGFWSGVVGIDEELTIYDHGWAVANAADITPEDRAVIARHMIALWERFAKTDGDRSQE